MGGVDPNVGGTVGDKIDVTDNPIPDPRQVPVGIDLELVKNCYNSFCDRCTEAGLPGPPKWT